MTKDNRPIRTVWHSDYHQSQGRLVRSWTENGEEHGTVDMGGQTATGKLVPSSMD